MCHTKTGKRDRVLSGRVRAVKGRMNTKEYTESHTIRVKELLLWVSTSLVSHTRAGRLYGNPDVNAANLEVNINLYLVPTTTGILYIPFLIFILNVPKVKCPVCGCSAIHTFNARPVFKRYEKGMS